MTAPCSTWCSPIPTLGDRWAHDPGRAGPRILFPCPQWLGQGWSWDPSLEMLVGKSSFSRGVLSRNKGSQELSAQGRVRAERKVELNVRREVGGEREEESPS